MKLFKVISSSGELSRRKSIDAIKEGMVTVNGQLILDPFNDVVAKDDIRLDNKKIKHNVDLTTILLNKPKGYLSTKSDEKGRKTIFELMSDGDKDPEKIVEEKGLKQQSDPKELEKIIDKIISENPKNVELYKSGKDKLFGFFVGQVMKSSDGKANPQLVNEILKKKLN